MGYFELHAQLAKDSIAIKKLELCEVRLITDANYPWLILVPQRVDVREVHKLTEEDQIVLMKEISFVAEKLEALTGADKMNIAALGNMVPQLHIHVVARFKDDPAWPGPIWGVVANKEYDESALTDFVATIRNALVP
ncbi:MAG: HIT domain-containing protein [Kordiimonas sp.]